MLIPPGMCYYGFDAQNPPRYLALGPGDTIPQTLLLALSLDSPILAAQNPTELLNELTSAMAPGQVLAKASALAAAAVKNPGINVSQAAAMVAGAASGSP